MTTTKKRAPKKKADKAKAKLSKVPAWGWAAAVAFALLVAIGWNNGGDSPQGVPDGTAIVDGNGVVVGTVVNGEIQFNE